MNKDRWSRQAVTGFVVGLLILSVVPPSLADSSIEFKLYRKQLVVVPVLLNGQGPFELMLDTGSTRTIVDQALAQELGLQMVDRSLVTTITGSQAIPRADLARLEIGSHPAENLRVLLIDMSRIPHMSKKIRGVIGQDVLSQFNFVLNYRKRRIEFEVPSRDPFIRGTRLPYEPERRRIVIPVTTASNDDVAAKLVLDTGIASLVVFHPPSPRLKLDITQNGARTVSLSSHTGSRFMKTGKVKSIRLGEETLRDLPVTLVQKKDALQGRTEDGLLPGLLFDSIYFNHRDHYVVLNPGDSE
jgi:predicted aspartyl protease